MSTWIESVKEWFAANPIVQQVVYFVLLALLGCIVYLVTKKIFLKWLRKAAERTKNRIDDILFEKKVAQKIALFPPLLIVNYFAYLVPSIQAVVQRLCMALLVWLFLSTISAFLNALNEIYEQKQQYEGRPIKGYIQTATLIIYILGILVIISILSGQSPLLLLSGVGALTAVLILVFRDTILSFVASLQITSNDLVRLGDWIEVPEFGADGDVIDIALHTVKVQNFDKTIIVIPTHRLIEKSFKNWRGMEESGGRRIKRAIHIDINSIRFVDEEMMTRLEKIQLLADYLKRKKAEIEAHNKKQKIDTSSPANGRRLTNMGTFRAYIDAYLRNHEKIDPKFTFLIRQLQPGPTGLPIEIYVFTGLTDWIAYEAIQADIFDHLFAVVKEFDLRTFQFPGGKDFGNNSRLPA